MFIIKLCKRLSDVMDLVGCSAYEVNRAYEQSWGEKYMYVADKVFERVVEDNRMIYLLVEVK